MVSCNGQRTVAFFVCFLFRDLCPPVVVYCLGLLYKLHIYAFRLG